MNRYFGVVLAGILIVGNVWGAARDDLQSLVAAAMEWNPRVRAAVHQLEQANAARAELRGFFDPQLSAGGEYRDSVYGRRETLLQAGVHAPALPGVYLDAAAEEHFFDQMGDLNSTSLEYELDSKSSLLGLNVPLLRTAAGGSGVGGFASAARSDCGGSAITGGAPGSTPGY